MADVLSASGFAQTRPGSEKDITEVSGTSSPGSIPGRGTITCRKLLKARCFLESVRSREKLHVPDFLAGDFKEEHRDDDAARLQAFPLRTSA